MRELRLYVYTEPQPLNTLSHFQQTLPLWKQGETDSVMLIVSSRESVEECICL